MAVEVQPGEQRFLATSAKVLLIAALWLFCSDGERIEVPALTRQPATDRRGAQML